MPKDQSTAAKKARAVQAATGQKYKEALRNAETGHEPRQWIITPDLQALIAGDGYHNIEYDLAAWLASERSPAGECDYCGDVVDARLAPAAIRVNMAGWNGDLSQVTGMLSSKIYHPACQDSGVTWWRRIDLPTGPWTVNLAADDDGEHVGTFEFTAHPVLLEADWNNDLPLAMLIVDAQVTDDRGAGTVSWLNALELELRASLFDDHSGEESPFSVRVHYGYGPKGESVLAVRVATDDDGDAVGHLYLGVLDLSEQWLEAAGEQGETCLMVGPLAVNGEVPEPLTPEILADPDALSDLHEAGLLLRANVFTEIYDCRQPTPAEQNRTFMSTEHGLFAPEVSA